MRTLRLCWLLMAGVSSHGTMITRNREREYHKELMEANDRRKMGVSPVGPEVWIQGNMEKYCILQRKS